MNIITKRMLINRVAEHWKQQYHTDKWGGYQGDSEHIYNLLKALPQDATEEDVEKIIDNKSWTRNVCDECKEDCQIVIEVGEPRDYESSTACLCPGCLAKAVNMINAHSVLTTV